MKRELAVEPDLEKLAHWDTEDKAAAPGLPALISARELYRGEVETLRPLFDGLLWDGLTMLIARPKAGKSWLTLQLAVHVAGGREVEGIAAAEHGPVLYAAIEEPKARTMARLRKIAPEGEWTENLHFVYMNFCRLWAAVAISLPGTHRRKVQTPAGRPGHVHCAREDRIERRE